MREMLKTASVLAAVSFVAAGLLALTENVTRDDIKKVAIKKKSDARIKLVKAKSFSIYLPSVIKGDIAEKKIIPALKGRKAVPLFSACYEKKGNFYLLKEGASEESRSKLLDVSLKAGVVGTYFEDLTTASRKAGGKEYKALARITRIYIGKKADGSLAGFVYECAAPEGYGGDIELVTGVDLSTNGTPQVRDYIVINSAETPGLGKKAEDQLHAKYMATKTKKRTLGDINPLDRADKDVQSGATITSMAIKDALYASLQISSVLKDSLSPSVNIPDAYLLMVPYGMKLEVSSNKLPASVHSLFAAKFHAQTMGFVALVPLQDFDSTKGTVIRRIVAAAVQNGTGRLLMTRVFEYNPEKKEWPVVNMANLVFFNKTEAQLQKDQQDEKDPLRRKAIGGILDAYGAIRGGR